MSKRFCVITIKRLVDSVHTSFRELWHNRILFIFVRILANIKQVKYIDGNLINSEHSLNLSMLLEDISLAHSSHSRKKFWKNHEMRLMHEDIELEDILIDAFTRSYSSGDLEDTIYQFISMSLTETFFIDGIRFLVYYEFSSDGGELEKIHFRYFDRRDTIRVFNTYYRNCRNVQNGKMTEPEWVRLSIPDHIFEIKLPDKIRRNFKNIITTLKSIDSTVFDPSLLTDMKLALDRHNIGDKAVLEVTKSIGWNARRSGSKEITEYYYFIRYLRFKRFAIEIRDYFLAEINKELSKIGSSVGFENQIVVKGLPTISTIDELEAKIKEHKCSFMDIVNTI